jgi:hypothetical protein
MRTASLIVILCSGCNVTVGSGVARRETRQLAAFSSLEVSGDLRARVAAGAPSPVTITADDNLLPLLLTELVGGRLVAGWRWDASVQPRIPPTLELQTPVLAGARASGDSSIEATTGAVDRFNAHSSGAARITVRMLEAGHATVQASGDSSVEIDGRAAALEVTASGSAETGLRFLDAGDVTALGSGDAQLEVRAASAIAGVLSGASRLRVWGHPPLRSISTSEDASVGYQ